MVCIVTLDEITLCTFLAVTTIPSSKDAERRKEIMTCPVKGLVG